MATVNDYLTSITKRATQLRKAYGKLELLDTEALEGNTVIEVDRQLGDLLDILKDAERRTASQLTA